MSSKITIDDTIIPLNNLYSIFVGILTELKSEWNIIIPNSISSLIYHFVTPNSGRHYEWKVEKQPICNNAHSFIRKAIDKTNGNIMAGAVKFIKHKITDDGAWEQLQRKCITNEIKILSQIQHKNIINVLAYNVSTNYQNESFSLIVYEYAAGGELFDLFIFFGDTSKLSRILARTYFGQLMDGISYLHQNGIIHRDIKPSNLLLDKTYNLKITGFEYAAECTSPNTKLNDWDVGTRCYQAPEILVKEEYDSKVDIFSMGVVLFIWLTGYPPFEHATADDRWYQNIVRRKYKSFWKSHRNCGLSQQETDLITRMICYNPEKRISMDRIKKHVWSMDEVLSDSQLTNVIKYRYLKIQTQIFDKKVLRPVLGYGRRRNISTVAIDVKKAGKSVDDLPPCLPFYGCLRRYDVYTSKNAYEVLEGLENVVHWGLKWETVVPNEDRLYWNDNGEEYFCEEMDVDIANFSFDFVIRLVDKYGNSETVSVYGRIYSAKIAQCNLVRFLRISGSINAFRSIIKRLLKSAKEYLTGLSDQSLKKYIDKDGDILDLYQKCFPQQQLNDDWY